MNKLLTAMIIAATAITAQAADIQKISFLECLNIEKASGDYQISPIANSVFAGAYRINGMIYTLSCGPVSTIRWETPNEYVARNKTK